jgi:predicted GIY-YIG superfamily endonuclease
MPKTNIAYSKTIIYKLINYDYPELVYVGSTTNFTKRQQHHKDAVYNTNSRKYNYKIYTTIRENCNWESWIMIKICNILVMIITKQN